MLSSNSKKIDPQEAEEEDYTALIYQDSMRMRAEAAASRANKTPASTGAIRRRTSTRNTTSAAARDDSSTNNVGHIKQF